MSNQFDLLLVAITFAILTIASKFFLQFYLLYNADLARPKSQFLDAHQEELAQRNYKLALELMRRDEYAEAERYLNKSETHLADSGMQNLALAAAISAKLATCGLHTKSDSNVDTLALAEKSLLLAQMSKQEKAILDSLFVRATVNMALANYAAAENDIRACLQISTKIYSKESEEHGRLLNNLGHVLAEQSKLAEALESLNQAAILLDRYTGKNSEIARQVRKSQENIWRKLYT